jgi:hypothetical protein
MLDWERWTLTHSSGEAGVAVLLVPGLLVLPGLLLPVPVPLLLGLGLGLGLELGLGLVAR